MKIKLVAVSLSAAMLASSLAFADIDPKFYVGAELQANKYKGAKAVTTANNTRINRTDGKPVFGNSGSGATAYVGSRFNDYLGVELGATKLSSIKFTASNPLQTFSSTKAKSKNFYVDMMGYLPVSEDVDLIGSLGAGRLSSKLSGNLQARNVAGGPVMKENFSVKSSKTGMRVGAGAQYKFTDNLSARLMLRHQKGNKLVKSVNSAGLGLTYQF